MTLVSVTAYHSFGGEVEALNTPTIRRLTPSCRHQLPRIARRATPSSSAPNLIAKAEPNLVSSPAKIRFKDARPSAISIPSQPSVVSTTFDLTNWRNFSLSGEEV